MTEQETHRPSGHPQPRDNQRRLHEPALDLERLTLALEVFGEGLAISRRVIDNPRDRAEVIASQRWIARLYSELIPLSRPGLE